MENKRPTCPEHNAWVGMWDRCTNPNNPRFADYGGRGIRVCQSWWDFFQFLEDMGRRPPEATGGLDRIDVNGHYEPSNCRWATAAEQNANRRLTVKLKWKGQQLTVFQIAKMEGVDRNTLKRRIESGINLAEAVEMSKTYLSKLARNRLIEIDGMERTLASWCRLYRIAPKLVHQRVHRDGLSWAEAVMRTRDRAEQKQERDRAKQ